MLGTAGVEAPASFISGHFLDLQPVVLGVTSVSESLCLPSPTACGTCTLAPAGWWTLVGAGPLPWPYPGHLPEVMGANTQLPEVWPLKKGEDLL